MLRVVAHTAAAAALKYYTEGLSKEDYYSEKQEIVGKWFGQAAERLELSGDVTREAFAALVANKNPATGQRLTARTNAERRIGYDLNFHAPKSLSILQALTEDEALVEAFRGAVAETMREIEMSAATRIRRGKADAERVTGNLVWGEFVHFTARPVGGVADPHLHVHCFAMNCTFDDVENRWKAASWAGIKREAPYHEAAFHARLADKVAALGYPIEKIAKGWEISGISRDLIQRFSRRGAAIERVAAEKGITNAKAKDALGAATREAKRHGITRSELASEWKSRLSDDEAAAISRIAERSSPVERPNITEAQAMNYASEKLFAKDSVVRVNSLVEEALRFGVGRVTPSAVWSEFERREMIVRNVEGEWLCTTREIVAEEVSLINFARTGRGMFAPIALGPLLKTDFAFSREQRAAIRHILKSPDQLIVVQGKAGVGKTTLMVEVARQINATGTKLYAFAQSSDATENLRKEGFQAETVAHLLANPKLQKEIRGQVVFVDEAGLLGIRDMWEVLKLGGNDTRVVLVGDTAQHRPVARGDALSLVEKYAGLKVARVSRIQRQETEGYRRAVGFLSRGELKEAFKELDDLGAVVEIRDDAERYRELAQQYLELSWKKSAPLVVSPTHREGAIVTDAIRDARREAGHLAKEERQFIRLHDLKWEEPDRTLAKNYAPGMVVQFHQNVPGFQRGARLEITRSDAEQSLWAKDALGVERTVPLQSAKSFTVFEQRPITIARGEKIRITHNGTSADGRRLNNGQFYSVTGYGRDGSLLLNTGARLSADHGHFGYGYCQTSYASQSKSVRDVLIAQNSKSFLASSSEQFYVSVSRGKQTVRIFTDDRLELQAAVGNTSLRRAGVDVAGLSESEISSFMSDEQAAKQWRDHIRSRQQAHAPAEQHVTNILRERKMSGAKTPTTTSFQEYVAMRRSNAGPDGKSLSRGNGSAHVMSADVSSRKTFLQPSQLRVPLNDNPAKKIASAPQPKAPAATPKRIRAAQVFVASKERFQKVATKMKTSVQATKAKVSTMTKPKTTAKTVANKNVKQQKIAKAKVPAKAPVKAPTPKR